MTYDANTRPGDLREAIRRGEFTGRTSGLCEGYVQANLVILPREHAEDFARFAQRNPKPCPVLEVTAPGDPHTRFLAPGANLSTEISTYRVFRKGILAEERHDIQALWREDFVAFLLGCSFSFEHALIRHGIEVRNITDGHMVSHYKTSIPCAPAGPFSGPVVVTMRPIPRDRLDDAYAITGQFPHVHGMPIYHGDPAEIGVRLDRPDWGEVTRIEPDEVPVFWACGVTPQAAIEGAGLDLAITHAPSCMFVSDIPDGEIEDRIAKKESEVRRNAHQY